MYSTDPQRETPSERPGLREVAGRRTAPGKADRRPDLGTSGRASRISHSQQVRFNTEDAVFTGGAADGRQSWGSASSWDWGAEARLPHAGLGGTTSTGARQDTGRSRAKFERGRRSPL